MAAAVLTTNTSAQPESLSLKPLPKPQRNNKSNPPSQPATVKSRKDASLAPPPAPAIDAVATDAPQGTNSQSQVKKLTRKSSKPIINWFQRKLAGTRARRASEGDALRTQRLPPSSRSANVKEKRRSSVPVPPLPTAPVRQRSRHNGKPLSHRAGSTAATSMRQNTISLDSDVDLRSLSDGDSVDSDDRRRTSSVLESTWSPNSVYEADEDASVRPIPPSAPPSPSPSHSSSSYLSQPRTFASMAASTKPTTLLSVDLTGGMAHIAQAPPTPTSPSHRMRPHIRTHSAALSSGGSITFSMLPPASPTRPSSSAHGHMPSVSSRGHGQASLQAPQHTAHHPRNNPRPSSPPLDDASVMTLASSAFGFPGARTGAAALVRSGRTSVADDSISHFSHPLGDSTSQFLLGDGDGDDERGDEERYIYGDVNASVRALRPRSSRRGSWESEASGWSARLTGAHVSGIGTSNGLKERSLWTSGSHRTGARSVQTENDEEAGDVSMEGKQKDTVGDEKSTSDGDATSVSSAKEVIAVVPPSATVTPAQEVFQDPLSSTEVAPSASTDKVLETPKGHLLSLEDAPDPTQPPPSVPVSNSSSDSTEA